MSHWGKRRATAKEAEKLIVLEIDEAPSIYTIEQAIQAGSLLHPPRVIQFGKAVPAIRSSQNQMKGTLQIGGQEHWYLETQTCLCIPGEDVEIKALSSTQHPSETQAIIAEVLGIHKKDVEVEVRRMGGAFGGKETQANHVAVWCALLAQATRRPLKFDSSEMTIKLLLVRRHPYLIEYHVGYNEDGKIEGLSLILHANAGSSTDLSMAVLERAMMHAENSYFVPNIRIEGKAWKTNLPSNTAFRGFGGPQGMAGIENILDRIARILKKDPLEVREIKFLWN